MTLIEAAVCTAFDAPLRIEGLRLRDPLPGEIAIRTEAVAVCHSDISFAEGAWGGDLPMVLGHEAAGIVTALGDGVTGIEVGNRVCVTLIRACGTCPFCAGGRPTLCATPRESASPLSRADGTPVVQAMHCAGFASRMVVHQSQVVPLSHDLPAEAVALLACGVITGVGAVVHAGHLRAGEDVVVIGAGGVGLNAIQGAIIAGARRVVAVDMLAEKLEVAKEFGATDTVLAEGKPWAEVKKILGRGADAVLVTVGVAQVYDQAPRYLGWGGKVVMVGMPHGDKVSTYSPLIMANQGQAIVGSKMGDMVIKRDIPWIVDMYKQGRLKLDELISGRYTLDQINDAIESTKSGTARRNVVILK